MVLDFTAAPLKYALPVHWTASATSLRCWSPWSSHTFNACHQPYSNDNARPHVVHNVQFFFTNQIELLPWLACSPDLSPIENMCSMHGQQLARDAPPIATPDQLWQYVEAAWTTLPQGYFQSIFESMLRLVAAVIANNCVFTNY
ncbi:transposable element Tcb1 transposase [Trichonephila clavipes]|nr:transposable element Tcb1 transposase [Trichonephila clavipes]